MSVRYSQEFKDTLNIMGNTTHNFVMFDRTYMGLLHLFNKMQAEVHFHFPPLINTPKLETQPQND